MTASTRILCLIAMVFCAGSAQAGGIPPFDRADRELFCTLLAESHVDAWSPEAQGRRLDVGDAVLMEVDTKLCLARFEDALAASREGRRTLADLPRTARSDRQRARLEVLAATAQLALGREASARRHLAFALELDPNLRLDAAETSPKVMAVFQDVRGEALR
jgi:hypothetical protein